MFSLLSFSHWLEEQVTPQHAKVVTNFIVYLGANDTQGYVGGKDLR